METDVGVPSLYIIQKQVLKLAFFLLRGANVIASSISVLNGVSVVPAVSVDCDWNDDNEFCPFSSCIAEPIAAFASVSYSSKIISRGCDMLLIAFSQLVSFP